MQAQLSPAHIETILTTVTNIKIGQAITFKHFQRVLRILAAASNVRRRMRPVIQGRVLVWNLAVILEGLSLAPFKPIDEVSGKFLTLKMAYLLVISSRVLS